MILLLLSLIISACSTDDATNYNLYLQSFVGLSQESLYESFGMPNSIENITPNQSVVTYYNNLSNIRNGNFEPYANSINYPDINTWYLNSNTDTDFYCNTSFIIENSKVIGFTFNGDDCIKSD